MAKFHCNCGVTITGTKRDIATHLAACATVRANQEPPAPRPPRPAPPAAMRADTRIVDPNTGEIIVEAGDELTDDILYRLECIGVEMHRCPHWASEVPDDWMGCAECLLADACYRAWERNIEMAREFRATWERAAQGAREAA